MIHESALPTDVLAVSHLRKAYGDRLVIRDITFSVARSEFVCLVGPSGVGKTTLLRCLSGLVPPTAGTVAFGGSMVSEPPDGLSVVLQDYSRSLLPWMRVTENVALPLRARGLSRHERTDAAVRALEAVGLAGAERKYPWQLSGGMQQRVAIARAIVNSPKMLLMDEPFASVDAQTRFELEDLTLSIRDRTGVSVVLVTHDIDEAVYLADKILVLTGAPASVSDIIAVPFGSGRDQMKTRADPLFATLRNRVFLQVRGAGANAAPITRKPAAQAVR